MAEDEKVPIHIRIKSKIFQGGEEQTINQSSSGEIINKKNNTSIIIYQSKGKEVWLKISPDRKKVIYSADKNQTYLIYDRNTDFVKSEYFTPYGTFLVYIKTQKIEFKQKKKRGKVHLVYKIFQQNKSIGNFDLSLIFSPMVSKLNKIH